MPFGGLGIPATAGAKPAPRRSTCTPTGRPSTSTTTRGRSEPVSTPTCVALHSRPRGLQAGAGQEHPAAGRPPAAGLHDRGGARERRLRRRHRLHRLGGDRRDRRGTTAPRCPFLRPAELAGDLSPGHRAGSARPRRARARPGAGTTASASCARRARSGRRGHDPARVAARSRPRTAPTRCARSSGAAAPGQDVGASTASGCVPLLAGRPATPPWHSMPYQALPPVYVQNASLEIAWTHGVASTGTIAGTRDRSLLHRRARGLRHQRADRLVVRGAPGAAPGRGARCRR